MADSTNTTTVLVVAAAAVVVAVLWSRRATAASPGGGRPPSGGAGSTPTPGVNVGGLLSGAGDLFSGLSDLAGAIFSSDDDASYTIPGEAPFDPFQNCGGPGQISCEELEAQQNVSDLIGGRS